MLAIPNGATALRPGLIPAPDLPSFAVGLDVGYLFGDEDEPFFFRPHLGPVLAGVATRLSDAGSGADLGSDLGWMVVVQGGLDVGYWITPEVLLLAGVNVRNTPRVDASVAVCEGSPAFLSFGDVSATARLSGEVEVTNDVAFFAAIAIPAVATGYDPYPILSIGARLSAGEGRHGLARPRPRVAQTESTPDEESAAEALADPRGPTRSPSRTSDRSIDQSGGRRAPSWSRSELTPLSKFALQIEDSATPAPRAERPLATSTTRTGG